MCVPPGGTVVDTHALTPPVTAGALPLRSRLPEKNSDQSAPGHPPPHRSMFGSQPNPTRTVHRVHPSRHIPRTCSSAPPPPARLHQPGAPTQVQMLSSASTTVFVLDVGVCGRLPRWGSWTCEPLRPGLQPNCCARGRSTGAHICSVSADARGLACCCRVLSHAWLLGEDVERALLRVLLLQGSAVSPAVASVNPDRRHPRDDLWRAGLVCGSRLCGWRPMFVSWVAVRSQLRCFGV